MRFACKKRKAEEQKEDYVAVLHGIDFRLYFSGFSQRSLQMCPSNLSSYSSIVVFHIGASFQ